MKTKSFFFFSQFIYVNQSFAPSPDQEVGVLFDVSVVLNGAAHTDIQFINNIMFPVVLLI